MSASFPDFDRSVSKLLRAVLFDDGDESDAALATLAAMGADGVVQVIAATQETQEFDDPFVKCGGAKVLAKLTELPDARRDAITALLADRSVDVRLHALDALSAIGGNRSGALAPLARMLGTSDFFPEIGFRAAKLLADIDEPALPYLLKASESSDDRTRLHSLVGLSYFAEYAHGATLALCKYLVHADREMRYQAAQVLGETANTDERIRESLAAAVHEDTHSAVRCTALEALFEVLPQNERVPMLRKALACCDYEVRSTAAELLETLGAGATDALADLQRLTDSPIDWERDAALEAIRAIRGE